jgi:hypothetical protein
MQTSELKQMSQSPHTITQDWTTEGCCTHGPINTSPPNKPLLHTAFKLKEVIKYNKAVLTDYQENHLEGPNTFPKWDKAKWLMRTFAIGAWKKKVRTRGSLLKSMAQLVAKLERDTPPSLLEARTEHPGKGLAI